ncbi:hypothetical protein J6A34_03715 [bacterium]|nr:hypothetical protein [bacterium]
MNKLFATFLSLAFLTLPTYGIEMAPIPEVEAIETEEMVTEEVKDLPYNFESTYKVPIKLGIITPITTKGETLYEGQVLQFKVLQDTYCKRKTFLKKGTIINGRIETLISTGMNGFPAEIIISNFEIPGAKPSQLVDTYTKKGQNRCYIVYPIKWALTIIPFVGSLTNLIKGGHAKIKAKDEIVIYYYPEWK